MSCRVGQKSVDLRPARVIRVAFAVQENGAPDPVDAGPPDYTETKAGPDRANEVYRPVRPTLVSLSWQVV